MNLNRTWLTDATERVIRAFLVSFIGVLLASKTGLYSIDAAKAAASAGIASGLSVVLSLLGATTSTGVSPASVVGGRRPKGEAGVTLLELLVVILLVLLILFLIGVLR